MARTPDPEAYKGNIENIVKAAHKWGGDGKRPYFRKIRSVLMTKHPEVVAKAFGGNPDVAAAWIKNNWYRMRGKEPPPTRGKKTKLSAENVIDMADDIDVLQPIDDDAVKSLIFGQEVTHELFLSGGSMVEKNGAMWKEILRTGRWEVHPTQKSEPFLVDLELLENVVYAFNDKAWEFVTIPLTHADRVEENTGQVRDVKIIPNDEGGHSLWGLMDFTEPDIERKARNGSIINVSCGIDTRGYVRQEDGKRYPAVLKHVALTNKPFVSRLRPFGEVDIAASLDWEGSYIMASQTAEKTSKFDKFVDALTNLVASYRESDGEDDSDSNLENDETDTDDSDEGSGDDEANDNEDSDEDEGDESSDNDNANGGKSMSKTAENDGGAQHDDPATNDGGSDEGTMLSLSQDDLESLIAKAVDQKVSDERKKRDEAEIRLSRIEQERHTERVNNRIKAMDEANVPPSVCKVAKEILLSDKSGEDVITLSREDDSDVNLSMTDVVMRLVEAMPSVELEPDINLSTLDTGNKPSDDTNEMSPKDAADAEFDRLTNAQ